MVKRIFLSIVAAFGILTSFAQSYTLTDKWVKCGNGVELHDPYYSRGVTFTWTGGSKNGKANGHGVATKSKNGVVVHTYTGEYKNGIREGKGVYVQSDEIKWTGNFVNGQLVGRAKAEYPNGDIYEGNFINYQMHGQGVYSFANGAKFEGYFVDNSPYNGKFTNYTGEITYIQQGQPVDRISEKKSGYTPKLGKRVTEYFDSEWNRCQAKDASFYRLITYNAPNKPDGIVKDYYISGELQSEFSAVYLDYDDEGKNFHEGDATWYHKNGKIEQVRHYLNNKLNGPNEFYYASGQLQSSVMYDQGIRNGDALSYYQDGKPQTIAKYENGVLHNGKYLLITEENQPFLVYNENFIANHEAWEYHGQNGIVQVNEDNTLSMQVSPDRTVSGGIYTGFSPMSENIISIVTRQRQTAKSVVMLLFGFKDWDNHCSLAIAGNQFCFNYVKNGVRVIGNDWKPSSAIKADVNELQVVNSGDKITFYINEVEVGNTGRIYYDGSLCGISVMNAEEEPIVVDAAQLVVHEVVDPRNIPDEYMPKGNQGEDSWAGSGSGFFLNESGYIATNHHVIKGATEIEVSFTRNGEMESHPATVIMSDEQSDVAIVKIEDSAYKPVSTIPYGMTTRIKDTGSEVFTLGYPYGSTLGTEVKFTDGKISSKTGLQGDVRVYQISVPIQPGNSGGPLFDMQGNVVGLTSAGLNKDYFKSENVNYAVKASYLKTLIDSCPEDIHAISERTGAVSTSSLTETIKQYEGYMVFIKVR